AQAAQEVEIAALTRSEHGSIILSGGERHQDAAQPTTVVDTTGAGDAYAAGFLAAWAKGLSLPMAGRWGSIAAAEVISHYGARPLVDLKELVA
ncbi:MAG: adenosine kinase, partial [Rubritepida sp.]|nr:adenosine kinase [Rubritepida sp.]